MALRVLMTKKKLDTAKKSLEDLRSQREDLEKRELDIEKAIEEALTEEEKKVVEEEIDKHEAEKADLDGKEKALSDEVSELEQELANLEAEQEEKPVVENEVPTEERKVSKTMETREFFGMNIQERDQFFARDDVKNYLGEVRSCIREKRALTNVGITIPEVFLGVLRQNIENYSKLYKHVAVRQIGGEARMGVMGNIPEAVWTACCANINELNLSFYEVTLDCYKISGYFAICNANLEDSDLDLARELLTAIGQAIGLALDKAILYGTGNGMPKGIVTRLAETSQPANYPPLARPWADLHTSNLLAINSSGMSAAELFAAIVTDFGAAKGKYSRGEKVWVMNEKTYTALMAKTVSVNAQGQIVAGVNGVMPVVGGVIEVLDFVPDNIIIAGYFDLYLLGERAGQKFAQSEHVRFLADQTVFKGTARYDGDVIIAEAFVVMGLNNTTPNASMDFAIDVANSI